jgi:HPt (histidine-containing phosphotransfer) domain-containing protein
MLTHAKQLDKKFLTNYYREMVNDIGEIFETFINETPEEVNEISILLTHNNITQAGERLHKIIPSFLSIGLPQLTVKLQIVEVYINYANLSTAKLLMRAFVRELEEYMPAIADEHRRLKAVNRFTKPNRTAVLAT